MPPVSAPPPGQRPRSAPRPAASKMADGGVCGGCLCLGGWRLSGPSGGRLTFGMARAAVVGARGRVRLGARAGVSRPGVGVASGGVRPPPLSRGALLFPGRGPSGSPEGPWSCSSGPERRLAFAAGSQAGSADYNGRGLRL